MVPDGWSTIQIEKLGNTFGGLTGKTSNDFGHGYPFLTYMQVFSQKTSDKEGVNFVQISEDEKQNKVVYGDILFTTSSETPNEIGMTSVFLEKDWSPYLNSFCFGLRPTIPSPIDPLFTKYVFRGDKFRGDILPLAQGSTRFNLSKGNLRKLSFLHPPLPEQKKIASVLISVDEVIEKTQSQINKLQDLKKGTMNELLTKGIGHTEFKDSPVGKIPEGWEVKTLGDLAKVKRGASPRPIQDPKWWGGTVGWTRISDVTSSSKYLTETSDYLSDEGVEKSVQIPVGEVILSICATIGRPIIIKTDVCIHDGFVWFDGLSNDIDREFYYYFLKSKEEILSSSRQTGTQGNLNTDIVSRLPIHLPPLPEQKKIASVLSSIDKNIEEKQRKLEQTQSLKKSLMQDLLTGKVRVKVN